MHKVCFIESPYERYIGCHSNLVVTFCPLPFYNGQKVVPNFWNMDIATTRPKRPESQFGENLVFSWACITNGFVKVLWEEAINTKFSREWREPGNSIRDQGMAGTGIGFLVLLLYENTWLGHGPCWQIQSGTGAGRDFLDFFGNS